MSRDESLWSHIILPVSKFFSCGTKYQLYRTGIASHAWGTVEEVVMVHVNGRTQSGVGAPERSTL